MAQTFLDRARLSSTCSDAHPLKDAAKRVAENPISGKGLRHVDRRHFFVQDVVAINAITVPRVDSKNNLADALTKIIDNSVYFVNFGASMLSYAPCRGSGGVSVPLGADRRSPG